MPENVLAAPDSGKPSCDAYLVLDDTAAVVSAPPSIAESLYNHFHASGVRCSLLPGHRGRDVIDFGNPSDDEERHIRALFASWRTDAEKKQEASGSCVWCAWLVFLIVALWLVALVATW